MRAQENLVELVQQARCNANERICMCRGHFLEEVPSKLEKKGFDTRIAGQKIRESNNFALSVSEAHG